MIIDFFDAQYRHYLSCLSSVNIFNYLNLFEMIKAYSSSKLKSPPYLILRIRILSLRFQHELHLLHS